MAMKRAPRNIRVILLSLIVLICLLILFQIPVVRTYKGFIFGTTYHILIRDRLYRQMFHFQNMSTAIEQELRRLNGIFSVYDNDSELSRFNRLSAETKITLSEDLYKVLKKGEELYVKTDGAWDGSVYPIMKLWRFNTISHNVDIPLNSDIKRLKSGVGYHMLHLSEDRQIWKQRSGFMLDLSSIAKGYAVDRIAQMIVDNGVAYYVVEIGGEVRVSEYYHHNGGWHVGISRPDPSADQQDIVSVIELRNQAVATSGDYRRFILYKGRRYAHVIDPRTGYPVDNGILSATVIASDCMTADGYATALMVMGVDRGLSLINENTEIEAMLITWGNDNDYDYHYSSNFKSYLR